MAPTHTIEAKVAAAITRSPRIAADPCGVPDNALSTNHARGHGSASFAMTCRTASTDPTTNAGQYRRTCDANNGRITRTRCAVNFVMSSRCLACVDSQVDQRRGRCGRALLDVGTSTWSASVCRLRGRGDLAQPASQSDVDLIPDKGRQLVGQRHDDGPLADVRLGPFRATPMHRRAFVAPVAAF